MGMDVIGRNPDSENGKLFCANIWWWPALWCYCCHITAVAQTVQRGYTNDGDGLDETDALVLASILRSELESGRTAEFARERETYLQSLPDEQCWMCKGKGTRKVSAGITPPDAATLENDPLAPNTGPFIDEPCGQCKGTGKVEAEATWYCFDADFVREFCDFLEHCGGFNIW